MDPLGSRKLLATKPQIPTLLCILRSKIVKPEQLVDVPFRRDRGAAVKSQNNDCSNDKVTLNNILEVFTGTLCVFNTYWVNNVVEQFEQTNRMILVSPFTLLKVRFRPVPVTAFCVEAVMIWLGKQYETFCWARKFVAAIQSGSKLSESTFLGIQFILPRSDCQLLPVEFACPPILILRKGRFVPEVEGILD